MLDEASPEEIARKKNQNIHNCCDFKIKTMAWVTVVEGVQHHLLGRPGSPYLRAFYPFILMVAIIIIKFFLRKKPRFEDNAAFMLTASLIIILTECSIFLSPNQFVISPV